MPLRAQSERACLCRQAHKKVNTGALQPASHKCCAAGPQNAVTQPATGMRDSRTPVQQVTRSARLKNCQILAHARSWPMTVSLPMSVPVQPCTSHTCAACTRNRHHDIQVPGHLVTCIPGSDVLSDQSLTMHRSGYLQLTLHRDVVLCRSP